jgi:hypothetical protein
MRTSYEYWSVEMYDHVKAAVDAGVHAAFFSGNSVDGVVEIGSSSAGVPGRTIERVGKFGGAKTEAERRFVTPWKRHGPDPALLMGGGRPRPPTARPTGPA